MFRILALPSWRAPTGTTFSLVPAGDVGIDAFGALVALVAVGLISLRRP